MKKIFINKDIPVNFSKKIWAFFIDSLFIIIFGCLFLNIVAGITQKQDEYKKTNEIVNQQIEKINNLSLEAKLLIKKDDKILNEEEMYKEYAIGHILLSYDQNLSFFQESGVQDLHNHESIYGKYQSINPSNDPLAYFYYFYLLTLEDKPDYDNLTNSEYYKKVLRDNNEDLSIFNLELDYPTLKPLVALNLYKYIIEEERMDNNEGNKANILLGNIFTATYAANSKIFKAQESYQKEYLIYEENFQKLVNYMNIDFLISYSLSFVIVLILIPLLLKNDLSLGKRVNRIIILPKEENRKIRYLIIRKVGEYILYYCSLFFISMLITGTNALIIPLFKLGNINIGHILFIFIFMILGLVNFLVSYIRKDSKSLLDLLSQSKSYNLDFELID